MPLADGQSFAGYTILRHLGSGMGEIYLAQHPRLPRHDALKVLPTTFTGDAEYRQRFDREADIAATLWHPHIVGVHDRGEFDGQLWISMDYVEGTDAARLLQEQYPQRHAAGRGGQDRHRGRRGAGLRPSASAAAPRRQARQHPDLARWIRVPSEILLADFGIARWVDDASGLTGTNMTVGTVAYAAPEQLMGEQLDGRADQYALAATAYHLLTGTPLFQHSNPAVVISQHLSAPPPPIGTRRPALEDLGPVFSKALSKSPADRYDTCTDFADALAQRLGLVAAETGATEATTASPIAARARHRSRPQRATKERSPRRPAVVVAVVLALLLIGVSAVALRVVPPRRNDVDRHASCPARIELCTGGTRGRHRRGLRDPRAEGQTSTGRKAYCARESGRHRRHAWAPPDEHTDSVGDPGSHGRGVPGRHRGAGAGVRRGDRADTLAVPRGHSAVTQPLRQPIASALSRRPVTG